MLKILIDTCVINDAELYEPTVTTQTINWGDASHSYPMHGYRKKEDRDNVGDWRKQEIKCLPTIGELIRNEKIVAHTTTELNFETWKTRVKCRYKNAFEGCTIAHIESAIERSHFQQAAFEEHINKNRKIKFCQFLLSLNEKAIEELAQLPHLKNFSEFQQRNFINIQCFKDICHGITPNHYPDAFYFWTAEVNECDYFLTVDRKFINVINNNHKKKVTVKAVCPSELLQTLKQEVIETPEDKEFHTIWEQN